MKAYAVQYRCSVEGIFDGDMCEWFSCKAKAIAKAKELRDSTTDTTEALWASDGQDIVEDYLVYGVFKVTIPTGKKELLQWLNSAECRNSLGPMVWPTERGE